MTTELSAINTMLRYIGEQKVTQAELDAGDVLPAVIAQDVLTEVNTRVQSLGLEQNTECEVTLSGSYPGTITVPSNVIWLVPNNRSKRIVVRGTTLYDLDNNTDQFTADVLVDQVILLDFDDLTEVTKAYIAIVAGRELLMNQLGETDLWRALRVTEVEAKIAFETEQTDIATASIFDSYSMRAVVDRGQNYSIITQ